MKGGFADNPEPWTLISIRPTGGPFHGVQPAASVRLAGRERRV